MKTLNPAGSVKVSMFALPYTAQELSQTRGYSTDQIVTFLLLAIPTITACFATTPVRERETKSKHQQMVSGVSIPAYWIANWVFDNVNSFTLHPSVIQCNVFALAERFQI